MAVSSDQVDQTRADAIHHLMTVLDQFDTTDERYTYAEWIVDAIIAAAKAKILADMRAAIGEVVREIRRDGVW